MTNVIIYSRVSTDEQAQQGFSLDYQQETLTRYCEFKGYNIVLSFVEDYSAKTFNRPEWKKILAYLKQNQNRNSPGFVEKVICLRYDRFSRNFQHSLTEIDRLKKLGCNIEMAESNIEMTSPESILTRNIMLTLPQIENEKISIRTMEGTHKARQNGCWTGKAPIGYLNSRIDKNSTLEFSDEAPLIKEAFEKMASGLMSADEIRRWLNGQGMKITKNHFLNVIRNVVYTGKILVKEFKETPEQLVTGLHPALITDDVFAAANDALNGRKRKMTFKDDKSDLYPLKGFLKCTTHNRSLSAYKSRGRKGDYYHYYVCTKSPCPRYPVDYAHHEIERILSQIELSAQVLKSYRFVLEKVFEHEGADRKKDINRVEKEIIELNQQITFIRGEYMGQRLPLKEYTEMKMEVETKLYKLNQTLVDLKQEMTPYKSYVEKEVPMLEDLVSFYRKCDGKTKKKILGCIFSEKLNFEDGKAANIIFTKPIQVLISITKVLQGYKKEKEVDKDLLYTYAP
jgi:DNA invertase Pin-like site-specific DNA recombinase